jgi:lipopolysaccharide/colanic/teichoic acid biosynthesis glycosyltransferase
LLRHTRIDVLPQLFNVLRGEMSIIDSGAGSPSFLD